jgi:3-hydroxybutyryl-CoA dehydrogenase
MKCENVKNVLVLGTGMMGPGIALLFARAGHKVTIWGIHECDAKRGEDNYHKNVNDLLHQEIITREEAERALSLVSTGCDLQKVSSDADFVCEAILEKLELKQEIFAKLDEYTKEDAVLTSNTSTLLPTQISAKMKNKSRMLVAHFWNPAHLCPLVEVCGHGATSDEAIQCTMDILTKIGNKPVLIKKEILGFIGNRLMHAMNREAISLIQKGIVSAEDIDQAVLASFGPRFANCGPMEYLDFCGLDLIGNIQNYLYEDLEKGGGTMPFIKEKIEENELGAKSGKGLCDWSERTTDDVRTRRDKEFMRRIKERNR